MTLPPPLPARPQPPANSDCCGGGCADCEWRAYERALTDWQRATKAAEAQQQQQQ